MKSTDRWRLVLGRYSHQRLPQPDSGGQRYEQSLDYLYNREYAGRGGRPDDGQQAPRSGSLDPAAPSIVDWLGEVRELFPRETVEIIERHALDRYGLTELVTDPEVLARIEPSEELLKTLLALKGRLDPKVLHEVRRIVRAVVDDLRK